MLENTDVGKWFYAVKEAVEGSRGQEKFIGSQGEV